MGTPQGKRRATAPLPGESPTKKPHTKEHHKKSTKQFPSNEQTARTSSSPGKAVKVPKSREPMTPTALKTPTTPTAPNTPTTPTAPKTPASAKLLGTKKATATAVTNH